MATKHYVYLIQRRDHEDHIDDVGRLDIVGVHATLQSANAAAKEHAAEEAEMGQDGYGEPEESKNADGGYECFCQIGEDERDNFEISVVRMRLEGVVEVAKKRSSDGVPRAQPSGTVEQPLIVGGDAEPAAKKPRV